MYVSIPSRGLTAAYVCLNPLTPPTFASSSPSSSLPPPPDGELDLSKPILVFLHAPTCSSASFSRQFADPRLRAAANLVGVDARLHGRTEAGKWEGKGGGGYTIDDSAECVMAVLDHLGFSYFVYGEGVLGCRTASWLAIRRPDKVRGLMLASPAYPIEDPEICASLEQLGQFLTLNKGPGGSGECPAEALEASYMFGSDPRQKDRKAEFKEAFERRYGAGFPASDTLTLSSYGRRKAIPADLLAQIKCPVVVLSGGGDKIVSPKEACEQWQKSFVNAKGGAKLFEIASAPTLLSWSDYNIVNRMLASFVQQSAA
ncbi:hypothetical protein JCM8547_005465 [Rhodosporidiobolus lusitaniae]